MATQGSGSGAQRDRDERRRMAVRWERRDRYQAPERREEREWRGRGNVHDEDLHDERVSSWDRDRDPFVPMEREHEAYPPGEDDRDELRSSRWDRGGSAPSGAGPWRRDRGGLDEGGSEQGRGEDRGFDRYTGGYGVMERGGRIAGSYERNDGDLHGGYGRGQSGYGSGQRYGGAAGDSGFYGREPRRAGTGYPQSGRFTEGSRHGGQDRGRAGGGHRGKGPAGYTRSDERIKEDVCDALTIDDRVDATGIAVAVHDGEVALSGTVPERGMKRIAEDVVEDVAGVRDVQNSIRVQLRDTEQRRKG